MNFCKMGRKTKRRSLLNSGREKRKSKRRIKNIKRRSKTEAVKRNSLIRKIITKRKKEKENKSKKERKLKKVKK